MSKGTVLTRTTNDALQYNSAGNACVEFFSKIGATSEVTTAKEYFKKAWEEDRETATAIVFWARAARTGAGRRDVSLGILDDFPADFIESNVGNLVELGYYKDLRRYSSYDGVTEFWADKITEKDGLACKWAPRKGDLANKFRTKLGMTNKQYRVHLKENSKTIEQYLAGKKELDKTDFNWVPGRALQKYTKAFNRKFEDSFTAWKEDKDSKANASAVWPHDVTALLYTDKNVAQKQWDNLPDFIGENDKILPIVDVSGSMSCFAGGTSVSCMAISIALGLYLSERNKGSFKDSFITFSQKPELCNCSGKNLFERYERIQSSNWGYNTDFERSYMLILEMAKTFSVKQEDMPEILLVLSDMQFDAASNGVHHENIKKQFEEAGYKMPKMVYWNLNGHAGSPATVDDNFVALVSGYSPSIMKAVLSGEDFTPLAVMKRALDDIPINLDKLPKALEL